MTSHPIPPHHPLRPRFSRARAEAGNFKAGPSMRLLPVVIVAALVMLGFRVQLVVRDIANTRTTTVELTPATAVAAQTGAAPAAPAGGAAPPEAAATPEGAPAAGAEGQEAAEGAPPAEGAEATGQPLPVNFDASKLTKSEIDTLQRLAERRDIITQRERELEVKEGLLKAAEGRIDGKIGQLQDLEKNIQGLMKQYDAQKQAEIEQLVKIYGAMKPKDAARIFDALEMPILVSVIQNMKEAKVAPIMAMMAPAKATALTEELSIRKQMPTAGGPG